MKAITKGGDEEKRRRRRRFRKMTPEEVKQATDDGTIRGATREEQRDYYQSVVDEAEKAGDSVKARKFKSLLKDMVKEDYAMKQKRRRKKIRSPKF